MNRLSVLILIVSIIALLVSGCSMAGMNVNIQNTEESTVEKQPIRLGYCPTMSGIAQGIGAKNAHVSLFPYEYTAQALESLNNEEVDVVLVGRIAEKEEIEDVFEKRLKKGLTLAGKEKRYISIDEMQHTIIHTYVDRELARQYIGNLDKIVFHETFDSAIEQGVDGVVLIDWSDFSDEFELIIPVDKNMNKIEKFRIPVLYSYDEVYINNLEV